MSYAISYDGRETESATTERVAVGSLRVASCLLALVRDEIAPGTVIDPAAFWAGLKALVADLAPRNRALLARRDELQGRLDAWHRARAGRPWDPAAYRAFLEEIGYLEPEGGGFRITTENLDAEIAATAGPQLVVPVTNVRYALNAANARWGSLYDALYSTDVIADDGGAAAGEIYNPRRGAQVITFAAEFLDSIAPLARGGHGAALGYELVETAGVHRLQVRLTDGRTGLATPEACVGYVGTPEAPSHVLLRHNDLHIELVFDPKGRIGRDHPAGLEDVVLEAAVTTIQDLEDSVATVDGEDKTRAYRNWLGLMKGDLEAELAKDGQVFTRRLNPDRAFRAVDGGTLTLPHRSLMLVRNVGHLMTTDAVLDARGAKIPEGILDAAITAFAALHDLSDPGVQGNSWTGFVYIVKPKMHGSDEIAFTVELFRWVEAILDLAPTTLKLGIMDEERRTTVNLAECIRRAADRVVFINTGFLDRTGDEIHTAMEAGPVPRKEAMKRMPWIAAYEVWNVDIGLAAGLPGRAQIGKGMWPKPDEMAEMYRAKRDHPEAGASTAWVPSPTAATLHALHYHRIDVRDRQRVLSGRRRASLDDILAVPLLGDGLSPEEIAAELDNNVQGILG